MSKFVSKLLFILLLAISFSALSIELMVPSQIKDPRFCGFVPRTWDGKIARSQAVLDAFKQSNPCPSTGLKSGPCPGWSMNHIWPLACGGCDSVVNIAWTPYKIKTCSEPWCVDRFERTIRYVQGPMPGFIPSSCPTKVIPISVFDNYYAY